MQIEDVVAVLLIAIWLLGTFWGMNQADALKLVLCLGILLGINAVVQYVLGRRPRIMGLRFRRRREPPGAGSEPRQ